MLMKIKPAMNNSKKRVCLIAILLSLKLWMVNPDFSCPVGDTLK
jgi:hypothetical protein